MLVCSEVVLYGALHVQLQRSWTHCADPDALMLIREKCKDGGELGRKGSARKKIDKFISEFNSIFKHGKRSWFSQKKKITVHRSLSNSAFHASCILDTASSFHL